MKGRNWYQSQDIAASYDDKRFSRGGQLIDRREKDAVLELLPAVDGRSILEIACGTGRFTVMLADRGADIVGLDISEAMLAQGRRKAESLGLDGNVEFVRGDAARLPFPDDHFDVVLAMRFFHLMPEPAEYLSELRRVTSERIVFDTFNGRSVRSVYNWLLPMGSRLYDPDEVGRLLEATGLELEDVRHDFVVPYGVYRAIPWPLAANIYRLDARARGSRLGRSLASVSYWHAVVPG